MKRPPYLAGFDSASAMFASTARYLRAQDMPMMGMGPRWLVHALEPLVGGLNRLPAGVRDKLYALSGWTESLPPRKLHTVRAENVARWMVSELPRRRFPAVAIGSSNGAATHLYAALGIPWLPQTFLVPVSRFGVHPDEPKDDLAFGREVAGPLLRANPEVQLHHMQDGNQDRLMVQYMTLFRLKRLALGPAFERFLEVALAPGGTLLLVECTLPWPTVRVGERHIFQHGGLGGLPPQEYRTGSERVEDFLERYESHRRSWDSPTPDGVRPEAEWGFEPTLREDVLRFARERGFRVKRLVFREPEHLSPLIADFYRELYRSWGVPANRLLVESFALHSPYWALRTASVPFWMAFNKEPSAAALERYLTSREPFDEVYLTLFSHGTESVGLVPPERWRALLAHARHEGRFLGGAPEAYPRDLRPTSATTQSSKRSPRCATRCRSRCP